MVEDQNKDKIQDLIFREAAESASLPPLFGPCEINQIIRIMQNVSENPSASAGWGGARRGAGRKKMEKGKYYGFTSSPDVEAILETVEGSKAAFINEAVRAYARTLKA